MPRVLSMGGPPRGNGTSPPAKLDGTGKNGSIWILLCTRGEWGEGERKRKEKEKGNDNGIGGGEGR